MRNGVLDLFCGGGGAGLGYRRAGFNVIGVDNVNHNTSYLNNAGLFNLMDWRDGLEKFADKVDFIHASPPCQLYSKLTKCRPENVKNHPNLIPPVREELEKIGKPYIIENVEGAPLKDPVMLCCWMFSKEQYRHRFFEFGGGLQLTAPPHRKHTVPASSPGHPKPGYFMSVGGHFYPVRLGEEVMDLYSMKSSEISEAIPPYYTEYLGYQVQMYLLLHRYSAGPEAMKMIWNHLDTTDHISHGRPAAST